MDQITDETLKSTRRQARAAMRQVDGAHSGAPMAAAELADAVFLLCDLVEHLSLELDKKANKRKILSGGKP